MKTSLLKQQRSGVNGTIIVNLPPEEAVDYVCDFWKQNGIDPVYLLAPTTTDERATDDLRGVERASFITSR